ncbi:hypothetical protein Bca4012_032268 [Brassica carinata]
MQESHPISLKQQEAQTWVVKPGKDRENSKFKIDDNDLKNKGGKLTVRVSNVGHVGHALHVWLNGEYHELMVIVHCQDPASVTFSVLSLAMHFHGWFSFFIKLYYKLPLKKDRTGYYEYVGFCP